MRAVLYTVTAMVLLLCVGCTMPSERAVYRVACEALANDPGIPDSARPRPLKDAVMGVAKNAARVDLAYEYVDADGNKATGSYTVWCKRVARRWELDRAFLTQIFPPPSR